MYAEREERKEAGRNGRKARTHMIPRMTTCVLVALISTAASASGWNDYSADIGQGFEISRMSSFQVCIGQTNGALLICPREGDEFGPVSGYAFTESHLLVKAYGAMPHPKAPELSTADRDKAFFFLIDKGTLEVAGPFTAEEFHSSSAVPAQIDWTRPENPDVTGALLGAVMFLGIAALIFGWPVVLVLLIAGAFLVLRKRRRAKTAANA